MSHPRENHRPAASISRRDFLAKGAATAASIPMASALLAACGKPPSSTSEEASKLSLARPDAPVTLPLHDGNPAIADGLAIEKGATLKLYNYDQYIYLQVVKDFEKRYGVKIEISTYQNASEALAKVRSGETDFDVFFLDRDAVGRVVIFDMVQPLNLSYIPNLSKNIWPQFSAPDKPYYDQGSRYTVPYCTWTTGIGWRNDMVDAKDDPWHIDNPYDIFGNARYKGKIGIYDDYRDAIAMSLLRNGLTDVNTGDPEALSAAKDGLIQLSDKVGVALTINGAYEDLPKGVFAVHQAFTYPPPAPGPRSASTLS